MSGLSRPTPAPKKPGYLCPSCSEDFASEAAFDTHRIGKHAYTFEEGLRDSPPRGWKPSPKDPVWTARQDGRRCLTVEEMETGAKEFLRNAFGRWTLAATLASARRVAGRSPNPSSAAPRAGRDGRQLALPDLEEGPR